MTWKQDPVEGLMLGESIGMVTKKKTSISPAMGDSWDSGDIPDAELFGVMGKAGKSPHQMAVFIVAGEIDSINGAIVEETTFDTIENWPLLQG